MTPLAREILDFWFGPPPHAARAEWFRKDPAFDAAIGTRFGAADRSRACRRLTRLARRSARDALARVLLLDQFTRNAFRDTPRAFAGDAEALATAIAAWTRGSTARSTRYERWFLYLPFEHAEDPAMQDRSLALFARLADETGERCAARVGREARGGRAAVRPLPASQRDPRPRFDARGDRVPAGTRVALLRPFPA